MKKEMAFSLDDGTEKHIDTLPQGPGGSFVMDILMSPDEWNVLITKSGIRFTEVMKVLVVSSTYNMCFPDAWYPSIL